MVERLRGDPRVNLLERTDFKTLSVNVEPGPFDFFTVDVSFVAARSMLRGLAFRLRRGAEGVVLVKPQFELPRHQVRGGDVSAPALRARALQSFTTKAERLGFRVRQVIDSPVAGGEGTVELLAHLELVERSAALPGWARSSPRAPSRRRRRRPQGSGRRERWFVVVAPGWSPWWWRRRAGCRGRRSCGQSPAAWSWRAIWRRGWRRTCGCGRPRACCLRAGEVKAREFSKLRRLVARLPWERWLPATAPLRPVRVQASASQCRLYHTGAVAETVLAGMSDRLKVALTAAKGRASGRGCRGGWPTDEIRVLARGVGDVWTLSVDSSGELLHRRGWRTEAGRRRCARRWRRACWRWPVTIRRARCWIPCAAPAPSPWRPPPGRGDRRPGAGRRFAFEQLAQLRRAAVAAAAGRCRPRPSARRWCGRGIGIRRRSSACGATPPGRD
jgi:hypothetical protein